MPTTGHERVDAVLAGFEGVDDLPLAERREALTRAQDDLAAVLDAGVHDLQRPILPENPQ